MSRDKNPIDDTEKKIYCHKNLGIRTRNIVFTFYTTQDVNCLTFFIGFFCGFLQRFYIHMINVGSAGGREQFVFHVLQHLQIREKQCLTVNIMWMEEEVRSKSDYTNHC